MLKFLYIPPAPFKVREKKIIILIISILYDHYIIFKNLKNLFFKKKSKINSTSGYIEDSIYSNAYIFTLPYNYCIFFSKILNIFFDGIFVNLKYDKYRNPENTKLGLIKLSKKFNIKKVLVDCRDTSDLLIEENILGVFDNVIKREKDKSNIHNKYISTMLPCTLVKIKISKKKEKIDWPRIGRNIPNLKFKNDVFFSGKSTSSERVKLIEFLNNKKHINFIYNKKNEKIPYNHYLENIYNSKINLAPSGHGEFTYRHLEILACCSFMMCEKSINQIDLPLPLKDGLHYISYNDNYDLYEKIEYYLKNEKARSKISMNGRKLLELHYSPKQHGETVLAKIYN